MRSTSALLVLAALLLAPSVAAAGTPPAGAAPMIHYTEIVTEEMDAHCATLAAIHGLTFGEPVADLGFARVAKAKDGSHIAVRKPMAAHETPIVRTYVAVADIAKAVGTAEASGAVIAYPPTTQGDTGTWAIYIQDGVQYGLWQAPR